jgi:hypothetical protein
MGVDETDGACDAAEVAAVDEAVAVRFHGGE